MKKKRRLLQSDTFWGCAAALLVLLQFWWLPGEDGSVADSYSTTIDGKLGLYRTLNELFPHVERDALKVVPKEPSTLVIVAPDRYPSDKEQQQLYEFVYNGGDLLFAPNWMSLPSEYLDEPTRLRLIEDLRVSMPSLGIELSYLPEETIDAQGTSPVATVPVNPSVPSNSAVPNSEPYDGDESQVPSEASQGHASPGDKNGDDIPDSDVPDSKVNGDNPVAENAVAGGSSSVPGGTPAATVAPPVVQTADDQRNNEIGREVIGRSSLVADPVNYRTTATLHVPEYFETETLIESASGDVEAATWRLGRGRVVVCSSADIFSNRSMLFKQCRRLAVRLIERTAQIDDEESAQSRIVISEYFNASDAYQSTGILLSPSLRIGTLQLVLVAVLGIWMAFHRFGPAVEVTSAQRRTLKESAQAVGNLQYRLQDGGAVIQGYLEYIRSQLRRRYGSLVRLEDPDSIASRTGMDPAEVRLRLNDARLMAQTTRLSSDQTADMLRWLSQLQQRLVGNRKTS